MEQLGFHWADYHEIWVFLETLSKIMFRKNRTRLIDTLHEDRGLGSSVGIATGYGLDGPGIESRGGRDFPHPSRPALGAHPASCTMGIASFPG